MKYFSFCLFFIGQIFSAYCQNLVPNPSFEEYLECPYSTAEFQSQVVDWVSFGVTPDYFHICSNELESFAGVPQNVWGYQQPVTGDAYAAVVTYTHTLDDEREYVACQLNADLTPGQDYYVMFYISFFEGNELASRHCATNKFGLRFFKDPIYGSGIPPDLPAFQPDNFAHIEYNQMLTDSTNWTLVEGWFTADEAYNWIALGNFYDDSQTDTLQLGDPNYCAAVYYLENVCVGLSPEDCSNLLSNPSIKIEQNVSVYPNPSLDRFTVDAMQTIYYAKVYNAMGQLIYTSGNQTDKLEIFCENWAKGMYFLQLDLGDDQVFQTKIIKQ